MPRKAGKTPKGKTHKGIAKRIKVTGTGKLKHHKCGKSHLLSVKSGSARRKMRGTTTVPAVVAQAIKEQMVH
jgi:large subunit ribosomal protein L35